MKVTPAASPSSGSSADGRWQLAQKVADSANFRNCPKLRAFLLYVCENMLLGRQEQVREQLIGAKVFGRATDYNLSDDNIVRVEARELRKRLEAYFAAEGINEPVVIEIPKGAYQPVFRAREIAPAPAAEPIPATSPTETAFEPEQQVEARPRGNRQWLRLSWLLVIALAITTLWQGVGNWRAQTQLRSASVAQPGVSAGDIALYHELLGTLGGMPNRETLLVLSNPKVLLYFGSASNPPLADGQKHTIRAPAELDKTFSDALNNSDVGLPYRFLRLTREEYTGMGESVAAYHMGRLLQSLNQTVRLTQGRFLTWDSVQKHDLILLGSPLINDWTFQNVARSNFNLVPGGVENVEPRDGELKKYRQVVDQDKSPSAGLTDYGIIKRLTSSDGLNILLLAGISSAGTAGVGEYFASAEKMRDVYKRIREATGVKAVPSNWEALIKLKIREGLTVESTAIAIRPARRAK